MNPRELAAAIYAMPYAKREARLQTIPYPERTEVEQHLETLASKDEVGHRRRRGGRPWPGDRSYKGG